MFLEGNFSPHNRLSHSQPDVNYWQLSEKPGGIVMQSAKLRLPGMFSMETQMHFKGMAGTASA